MTFTDLPQDWRRRPLSDAVLAADVVDLFCSEADRRDGRLLLVVCDEHDHFKGAVVVPLADLTGETRTAALEPVLEPLAVYPEGAMLLALARNEPPETTTTDTEWITAATEACHQLGIRLLGIYIAARCETWQADTPPASAGTSSTDVAGVR